MLSELAAHLPHICYIAGSTFFIIGTLLNWR